MPIGYAGLPGSGNQGLAIRRLSNAGSDGSLLRFDAEASPSRSIATHLRGALNSCRGAFSHAARLVLDIALATLCVACREPVDGEGVCANCWSKLSFIAKPFCLKLGIPFVYDPGPELLSMEADPPAYARARAAVRYDDVARTLVHALKYQDRTDLAPAVGRWMARRQGIARQRRLAYSRSPCIGGAPGAGVTTSRGRWRAQSSARAGSGCEGICWGAFVRPNSRSGCRGRSAPAMCRCFHGIYRPPV
jgi:Double zinc ribbon domain